MATTVSIAQVNQAIANQATRFVITVSNTGAAALTLNSVQVSESTEADCIIAQPNIVTPNVAVGVGNPVISAASSSSFPFSVIFPSPNTAGASPNQPGLGPAGMFVAQPGDSNFTLLAQCQTSDGSVASFSLVVPVLSATAPFPRPEGGALQFSQGSNLINGLIMGVL